MCFFFPREDVKQKRKREKLIYIFREWYKSARAAGMFICICLTWLLNRTWAWFLVQIIPYPASQPEIQPRLFVYMRERPCILSLLLLRWPNDVSFIRHDIEENIQINHPIQMLLGWKIDVFSPRGSWGGKNNAVTSFLYCLATKKVAQTEDYFSCHKLYLERQKLITQISVKCGSYFCISILLYQFFLQNMHHYLDIA